MSSERLDQSICPECGRKHKPEKSCSLRPASLSFEGRSVGERFDEADEIMNFDPPGSRRFYSGNSPQEIWRE